MMQVQWKQYRNADGNPSPGSHSGGPEGGVWRSGSGERTQCGADQPEDDGRVRGFQSRWCQQRYFYHGGFWWVLNNHALLSYWTVAWTVSTILELMWLVISHIQLIPFIVVIKWWWFCYFVLCNLWLYFVLCNPRHFILSCVIVVL